MVLSPTLRSSSAQVSLFISILCITQPVLCLSTTTTPTTTSTGAWSHVPAGPPDAILGIAAEFRACKDVDRKVNLCVGAYRGDDGLPWVLPTVQLAQQRLLEQEATGESNKEYLPIEGDAEFLKVALEFAYGSDSMNRRYVAAVQTLSGTGACRIAGEFLAQHHSTPTTTNTNEQKKKCVILIPTPTWGNHWKIFAAAGLDTRPYRYFDATTTRRLDMDGLLEDLATAPDQSVVLLHACAHNPTGCDPTHDQWRAIAAVCHTKRHVVLMDAAYQGFASGDPQADAWALRYFVQQQQGETASSSSSGRIPVLLAQSFAKNFGLYGERCGTLSVVCDSATERDHVLSQLRTIVRPMYSSPPKHGSSIVRTVLQDPALAAQYREECATMSNRMQRMRTRLADRLTELTPDLDWSHIRSQIGMFAYTGYLTKDMCERLQTEHAVFLTRDGRISLAGLNDDNLERVAKAMQQVLEVPTAAPPQ